MAMVHGSVGPFDSSSEDWSSYAERLQQYFIANDVADEDKKRAIHLSNSGPQTYQLVKNLLAPAKPTEKTFTDIVAVLKEHWQPKPSEIVQRHNFHSRVQKEGESIADYVAELRRLSEHCGFKENTLDDMLRERYSYTKEVTSRVRSNIQESLSDGACCRSRRTAVEGATRQGQSRATCPLSTEQEKSTDLTQGNCYRCGGFRHNSSSAFSRKHHVDYVVKQDT